MMQAPAWRANKKFADIPVGPETWAAQNVNLSAEIDIAARLIRPGDVVFDIGAHRGAWSRALIERVRVTVHAFEPNLEAFSTLSRLPIYTYAHAVGCVPTATLHLYSGGDGELNSLYLRPGLASRLIGETPVQCRKLDELTTGPIHLLKIDAEGAEADVLRSATGLLAGSKINAIQFEYGGTWKDAGETLENAYNHLARYYGFYVYRLNGDRLAPVTQWDPRYENYRYSVFYAIHR